MMHDHHQTAGLTGQLSTSANGLAGAGANPRKAERTYVDMGAGLRQRGASGVSVQVLDLSTHGFRASTHLDLQKGADVWLKLPGLEALHARVAWMNGYLVGCEFVRPLHPAVLQMVVRR
jgi:hypothetical protein